MENKKTGDYSTGYWSTGDRSTGDWSTGDRSTGDWSTGDYSTGYWSTGDHSTGHCSTGYRSTGGYSTGNWSTGDHSTGNRSTGDRSTGGYSTGNWSTGGYSTGHWSISNYSTGHFSTEDYAGFGAFNKPCTPDEWANADKPNWLYFDLTEWVSTDNMSDQEKEDNPSYKTTGGYLRVYGYQEAFQKSYNEANREEQLKIKELPNFDADVFFTISGIRIDAETEEMPRQKKCRDRRNAETEEMTLAEVCKELKRDIKIVR